MLGAESRRRPPDLLLVVMDCVRASDFPGGTDPVEPLPFIERLHRECLDFRRSTTVAPWTGPSHATLFTGVHPWEHGFHLRADACMSPGLTTLAGALGSYGYASISLSANGFISPPMGLVRGFESAAWGEWWEPLLRRPDRVHPPRAMNYSPTRTVPSQRLLDLVERQSVYLRRFPVTLDLASCVAQRLRPSQDGSDFSVAPWIETTLRRWLRARPRETPVFCFVNLLEGHEPYAVDPSRVNGLFDWWRHARIRMDRSSMLTGAWRPTAEEFSLLHKLYRDSIRVIDRRLAAIIGAFEESGRWSNTVLVLTSDHGQAFGEHGHLFHTLRMWEPLLRVPLWLRLPSGHGAGRSAIGWASLVDVAPTLLAAAGASDRVSPSSVLLPDLLDAPRPTPAFAIGDGVATWDPLRYRTSPERLADLDRTWVAAYDGDSKLLLDVDHDAFQLFDIARDPAESRDLWPQLRDRFGPLADEMRSIGHRLLGRPPAEAPPEVTERLRSWGYL